MIRSGVDRQIITMGGGGFSMEPENILLDRYILDTIDNKLSRSGQIYIE
jgi:dipeptidase E